MVDSPVGLPQAFQILKESNYTAVGHKNVGDIARQIVEEHLDLCIEAGINHEGVINAEVAKGQWEFQIFGKGSKNAADQVHVARYILLRVCEQHGVDVNFHCKPFTGDWNGSGMQLHPLIRLHARHGRKRLL